MADISVRDEYAPKFGRQVLTLWSGAFASDYEGEAIELPGHNGYMVTLDYFRGKVRVECEAPRTDENWMRVDAAINAAVTSITPQDTKAGPRIFSRPDYVPGKAWR